MSGRAKILVVEDDPNVRQMVVRMLSPHWDVVEADNGESGLDHVLGGFRPDLVVCDIMMPKMDGLAFTQELKKDPALARIPVVFLSAKSRPKDIIDGINAGARAYVTKPFKSEELLGKVRKALGQAAK
jgi:CheY-like chemotaxis protein